MKNSMKILNLRKLEENIAILWDGENDTLDYLNNEFLSYSIRFDKTKSFHYVISFEKQINEDLLFTSQCSYDLTEKKLKTFKKGDFLLLIDVFPYIEKTSIEDINRLYETLEGSKYKDISEMLKNALENEDYILAAKLRDLLEKTVKVS